MRVLGQTTNQVLIVTKNDKFDSFGNNSNGCLSLGHKYPIEEHFIVNELRDQQIIQISYGLEHVMALTRSGQCFSWVWTLAEKSEIRTNRCKHSVQNWDFSQIRWNRDNTEVIYRSSNQLMAIVMFGVNIAIKWLIIRWKHVLNQFAIYSSFTQTVVFLINKSVLIKGQSLTQLPEDLSAFNNCKTSDFKFKIEDKIIYTHKSILKINCEHFKNMFS